MKPGHSKNNYNLELYSAHSEVGTMSSSTGYEPKIAQLSDAEIGNAIGSNVSNAANLAANNQEVDENKMALDVAKATHSSSSIATTRSVAGGDSVAVKRRLVDTLLSSPTKDDLYLELNEANAKLLQSEGETQKVKAIMSAKCNATISTYMQNFRAAAGQFQILSQEIFQSEEHASKTVLEQRINDVSSLLETQSFAHEEQAVQFRQYTERLENHANAEFTMFKTSFGSAHGARPS